MDSGQRKTTITVVMCAVIVATLAIVGALFISTISFSQSYEERLEQAQAYVDIGDYEAAVLIYEQTIEEDPDDPEAYLGLAEVYRTTDQIERAIALLREGLARTDSERIAWLIEEFERLKSEVDRENEEAPEKETVVDEVADEMVPESDRNVNGQVIDASSGSGVSGATLEIRPGSSLASSPIDTISTDNRGFYSVQLDRGDYWITVIKHGYAKEDFKITIANAESKQVEDFIVTSELNASEIRIVLTWDATPRDLDSYLTGTLDDGTRVNVDYTRPQSYGSNRELVADLDVDDTSGYGPETITLYDSNGSFEYYVQDFTRSGTMSNSRAQVKIYVGDNAPVIVDVPSGLNNGWSVCRIDHGRVSVTNTARGR